MEDLFPHLLFGNGDKIDRLGSLHGDFEEGGGGGIYDISNFLGMTTQN